VNDQKRFRLQFGWPVRSVGKNAPGKITSPLPKAVIYGIWDICEVRDK